MAQELAASQETKTRNRRLMAAGLLLFVFVATRAAGAWVADHPEHYNGGLYTTITFDPTLYEDWAHQVYHGATPYGEVKIEYPPGSLPFMILPVPKSAGHAYLPRFIAVMLAVDVAGMAGLLVIARRTRSWWGPWTWTLLVPMLGPIAYTRLDLVPAVTIIWALERAQARGWFGAGGWLGFGAVAKIYPGLLVPLLLAARWRWRWRILAGAVSVFVVCLLPFVGSLPGLWDSVVGYHTQRGLQIESTWGVALLASGQLGHTVLPVIDHGSWNTVGAGSSTLKAISVVMSVSVLATGIWLAAKRVRPDSMAGLSAVMFGTLALTLAVGTVFSPQFMLLLCALGAGAASFAAREVRVPLVLLGAANVLSQLVYPLHYNGLLANNLLPVTAVIVRNAMVLAIGLILFYKLWRGRFEEEAAPDAATEPALTVAAHPVA
ncbi:MAG: glycosyltransferase 87 family protein [Acidimicrobiales bacterium]